jgi:hypothetical protein
MLLYFRGSGEVLPEYYCYDFALCLSTYAIIYLLLRVLVYIIIYILPDVLRLIVDSILKVVLVVGIIYRYLDYPSTSFDSSDLFA